MCFGSAHDCRLSHLLSRRASRQWSRSFCKLYLVCLVTLLAGGSAGRPLGADGTPPELGRAIIQQSFCQSGGMCMQRLRYVGLAVGITFALLLALWVAPVITQGATRTIRVGENGDSPHNPNTGATLQAAINAANPGYTILVRGGNTPFTTTQPITITKSLIIRGGYNSGFTARDSGYTILEAAGAALRNQSVVFIGSQTIAGCPPTLAIES